MNGGGGLFDDDDDDGGRYITQIFWKKNIDWLPDDTFDQTNNEMQLQIDKGR